MSDMVFSLDRDLVKVAVPLLKSVFNPRTPLTVLTKVLLYKQDGASDLMVEMRNGTDAVSVCIGTCPADIGNGFTVVFREFLMAADTLTDKETPCFIGANRRLSVGSICLPVWDGLEFPAFKGDYSEDFEPDFHFSVKDAELALTNLSLASIFAEKATKGNPSLFQYICLRGGSVHSTDGKNLISLPLGLEGSFVDSTEADALIRGKAFPLFIHAVKKQAEGKHTDLLYMYSVYYSKEKKETALWITAPGFSFLTTSEGKKFPNITGLFPEGDVSPITVDKDVWQSYFSLITKTRGEGVLVKKEGFIDPRHLTGMLPCVRAYSLMLLPLKQAYKLNAKSVLYILKKTKGRALEACFNEKDCMGAVKFVIGHPSNPSFGGYILSMPMR